MTVDNLLLCLDDPVLPLFQWQDLFSVAKPRLPKLLLLEIEGIITEYESVLAAVVDSLQWDGEHVVFPATPLLEVMNRAIEVMRKLAVEDLIPSVQLFHTKTFLAICDASGFYCTPDSWTSRTLLLNNLPSVLNNGRTHFCRCLHWRKGVPFAQRWNL